MDIDSSEQAQQLAGGTVYFENKYIKEGNQEEVSLNYFIGFTIMDGDQEIGQICDIDDNTENWLFVVENKKGNSSKEILIPAHEEFITDIDHQRKIITMNLPIGLISINE